MTTLLHDLIDAAERTWPDRPAVSTATDLLTHRQVAEGSRRLASWLTDRGVARGDRVVLVAPSGTLVPVLVYAASRIGAAFTVLHEQTRGRPLEHVLDDSEPALLVAAEEEARAAARFRGIRATSPEEVEAAAFADAPVGSDAPTLADTPVRSGPLAVDPVCLIYTSGTTSLPKAVVSTHQQVVFAVGAIQSQLAYRPDDVVYCPLPLSFDYGLYQLFLGAASGAHVRLGQPAEVGPSLLRNLVGAGATVLASVPAVAETLARLVKRSGGAGVPPLRLLTNTGAAMPVEPLTVLRAAIPTLRVQLMYGLTECKRAAIMPPDGDLERPGASGRALPGTELFAIDADGRRLPPGEIGELVVRGPNVMAGYWRRPELSAQRFHRAEGLFPELRTGDYGRLDEDGYVYFDGRRDDIYKQRGFRVSATEVEAAVRRVPGVESAVVLPPDGDRSAVLVVVGQLTADEVTTLLKDEIEEFKIPHRCVVAPSLPLTGNGKVDRKALLQEVVGGV
ncbi:AMP-dependent synthetase [Saccharothrix sp. NRRL B-16348]|uniref:class I adenylate-forming enzyme family protein n=1 Tax=Saccharothrix sp. NRRL B-16348 TaxID=1415542 RepID=UPI0006B018C6|nr:class I adenylate-forming enzyme family protein [Saccharothrix sp. NRRL B-16348]KOX20047.1 AMP-dependent synthetase [Saccharothrix sp. NRRL B-16348]